MSVSSVTEGKIMRIMMEWGDTGGSATDFLEICLTTEENLEISGNCQGHLVGSARRACSKIRDLKIMGVRFHKFLLRY